MAISVKPGGDDDLVENSDINVTPFIDVILVLLIIFMVAAPLSTVDVQVELPVAVAKPQPRPDKPVFVTVKSDLTLSVGERGVPREQLVSSIDMETRLNREQRIFIRADQSVPYGELMRVLNALRSEGYFKVGLTGLDGGAPPAAPAPAAPAAASPAPAATGGGQ